MKFLLAIAVLVLCSSIVLGEKARFDNYRVYTLKVTTDEQLTALQGIEEGGKYEFWTSPNAKTDVDIMVPPHKFAEFSDLVDYLHIEFSLKIENVQALIDSENPEPIAGANLDWRSYATFEEIQAWINLKLGQYPALLTSFNIGWSTENRPMPVVRLSAKAGNPVIFVECNIHAREWITAATCTWFLNELLTSTDPVTRDLATNIDWYILPVANPDGYVFSHVSNRMWRKTRAPGSILCSGVDPNRNFDWYWMRGGASANQCTETYAGPFAFSEPETRAIRDFYASIAARTRIYLSIHAFGQYLLLPFGHSGVPSANHNSLMTVGRSTADALSRRYGTSYVLGSTANVLYVATGGSADWALGTYHTNLAYTFELRDIRGGPHGFILPADQIIPNCLEFLDGIKAMIQTARSLNQL